MARAVLVSTGNGAAPTFARPGYDQTEWHPAVCVSFHDAQAYVAWMKKITGKPYRLPSAAEWEYAARATTVTPFVGGASLTDDEARIANPAAAIGPVSVGSYSSNGYRLHDMHGNVAEWTEDCATSSLRGVPRDGSAQNQVPGCQRVFKGGSWSEPASRARSAARTARDASAAGTWIGFRAARDMN
jgi:formylglycine-generating enzyme required for sulfatase activity